MRMRIALRAFVDDGFRKHPRARLPCVRQCLQDRDESVDQSSITSSSASTSHGFLFLEEDRPRRTLYKISVAFAWVITSGGSNDTPSAPAPSSGSPTGGPTPRRCRRWSVPLKSWRRATMICPKDFHHESLKICPSSRCSTMSRPRPAGRLSSNTPISCTSYGKRAHGNRGHHACHGAAPHLRRRDADVEDCVTATRVHFMPTRPLRVFVRRQAAATDR